MAYEKQTWQTGETITAQKLNHMEDGIGAVPVMQLVSGETNSADALDAFEAGKLLYFTNDASTSFYIVTGIDATESRFIAIPDNNLICSYGNIKISITTSPI